MKPTPYIEEVIHLAAQFLREIGEEDMAEKLEEEHPVPEWIQNKNPLLKKGLTKVLKQYVRSTPGVCEYFVNRVEPEIEEKKQKRQKKQKKSKRKLSEEEEKQIVQKQKSPQQNKGWMASFERPKRLQDIIEEEKRQSPKKVRTPELRSSKKHKKIESEVQSSQYQSQKDSFELEPKKKFKKDVKIQKKVEKVEKKEQKKVEKTEKKQKKVHQKQVEQSEEQEVKKSKIQHQPIKANGYKQSFSRINKDQIGPISEQLRDNSFQAKFKFGKGGDEWGQYGYQKLKDTRGDSFKKTKGKLKNKAFQGASIDFNKINSIPIL